MVADNWLQLARIHDSLIRGIRVRGALEAAYDRVSPGRSPFERSTVFSVESFTAVDAINRHLQTLKCSALANRKWS